MELNDSLVTTDTLSARIEDVLGYFPENPGSKWMEERWLYMMDNYSKWQIATWGNIIFHEIIYFGLCLPGFLFQFVPYLQKYKIQQNKPETFEGQWKCFKLLMLSHFGIQLPLILGTYPFTIIFGIPYEWEHMPRWYTILYQVMVCLVVEDTWHYWFHRLLHHKRFYRHVHKIHHTFQAPFGMTAEYAHPIETFVLGFGFVLGLLLMCNHVVLLWAWGLVRVLETVDVHSGYDFPWLNPLHVLPGYSGSRFHDFHHFNFTGNYAPTFRWWDWLCGTDAMFYEHEKKRLSAQKKLD